MTFLQMLVIFGTVSIGLFVLSLICAAAEDDNYITKQFGQKS